MTTTTMPTPNGREVCGVAVLARRAEVGVGKTRLAATLGAERAFGVYRGLIRRTAAAVADSGLPATVCFAPAIGDEDVWPAGRFGHAVQPASADLGERIAAGLRSVLAEADAAIAIGTDCPELTPALLRRAAGLLRDHDAVLGPSDDGGFYLLGVRDLDARLFDAVAWSGEQVAARVRSNVRALGWTLAELPTLADIDTEADLRAYQQRGGRL